eukprot:CAMPEP_0206242114 /NCGR_PEP_ID=MMETSP0047_2-20121206/16877_1 /ASSEMBLY_ACC=CAM_ASM_000192 /TAXON_ID=195065 /ORGANISM="Chroomonas mesostigmatica_cf, Strain CCMP1168" /LENGTH=119 /DNA_ID=CAMNT_0053667097 /DNA_START=19 /DNA_END=378 /DNA_ORIENTATION=-
MLARSFFLLALLAATSAFSVAPAGLSLRAGMPSASVSRRANMGLRMQEEGNQTPAQQSAKRVGASVDADGKGNVWAVEPKMQVEDEGKNKLILPAALVGGLVGLLAILAATPLTNPDQL